VNQFFSWCWRLAVLALLVRLIFAVEHLAVSREWPERVTQVNHNRYDVAVYDGGEIVLPKEERK
jgi:hypothetical protein